MSTLNIEVIDLIQRELMEDCTARHRGAYGGRGTGKSWTFARFCLTMGMADKKFIVCVREVQKSLENSVMKLLADTIDDLGLHWFYKVMKNVIVGKNGTKFVFYGLHEHNSDNIKSLEGADICWVAEAQSISRVSINILRPTIRKEDAIFFWDFNPRYGSDPVYVDYIRNQDPNAKFVKVGWEDNPWFPKSLEMERDADYARDPIGARHIWEGELADTDDTFVCPPEMVEGAMGRKIGKNPPGIEIVGIDVAHQGGDEITMFKRINNKVTSTFFARKQGILDTLHDVQQFAGKNCQINIDNGHVGAALADLLEADGYTVNRIDFGGRPVDIEHYEDVATEMYFQLRDKLDVIELPKDEELAVQLYTRKYDYINGRRGYEVMKIEQKKTFAEHTHASHKSPDRADGLVLCFYEPTNYADLSNILGSIKAY